MAVAMWSNAESISDLECKQVAFENTSRMCSGKERGSINSSDSGTVDALVVLIFSPIIVKNNAMLPGCKTLVDHNLFGTR